MPREVSVLLWIAIVGVVAWLLVTFVPMPHPFPTLLIVVAVILCVLMALRAFGVSMGSPP